MVVDVLALSTKIARILDSIAQEHRVTVLQLLRDRYQIGPMTGAARTRRWRDETVRDGTSATLRDEYVTAHPSQAVTPRDENVTTVSREGGEGGVLALDSQASKTRKTQDKAGVFPSEGFEAFYALYPRKRDCARARKAYVKAVRDTSAQVILAGLRAQLPAMLERIAQGDMQFVPHPTTWLNGARWLPEVDPALVSANGHPAKPLVSDAMRAAMEPRP